RERVEELVSAADVVITGYRPAALAGFGLGAEQLLQRHPGLVVGELAAWGFTGPWSRERGFDSIVQAASGIAHRYRKRDGRPGALPVQALDHSAGYLLAAAVMRLLARRPETGGGVVRVSLARVARELLGMAAPEPGAEEPEPWPLRTCECPHGELAYVPPPFLLDGEQLDYSSPPSRYGQDDLVCRSARSREAPSRNAISATSAATPPTELARKSSGKKAWCRLCHQKPHHTTPMPPRTPPSGPIHAIPSKTASPAPSGINAASAAASASWETVVGTGSSWSAAMPAMVGRWPGHLPDRSRTARVRTRTVLSSIVGMP